MSTHRHIRIVCTCGWVIGQCACPDLIKPLSVSHIICRHAKRPA